MQELLETDQLHGLHHPGVAHHEELLLVLLELFGQLDQRPQARGIEKIDAAQIDHHRSRRGGQARADELKELLVGVGVELTGEGEQLAPGLLAEATPQGYGQSLKV